MPRLFLLSLGLFFALAVSASAEVPVLVQQEVTTDVQVATAYWQGRGLDVTRQCPDGVAVNYFWDTMPTVEGQDATQAPWSPVTQTGVTGYADYNSCAMTLSLLYLDSISSVFPQGGCDAVVHEMGHDLGLHHSFDLRDPMQPEGVALPECSDAYAAPPPSAIPVTHRRPSAKRAKH